MATQTRAQLISAVAKVLGMFPSGQTIEAEDYASLDEQIDPAIAELRARNVYYTANTASFENAVVPALADCIAAICAGPEQVTQIRGLSIEDFRAIAERRLRSVAASPPVYSTMQAEYF